VNCGFCILKGFLTPDTSALWRGSPGSFLRYFQPVSLQTFFKSCCPKWLCTHNYWSTHQIDSDPKLKENTRPGYHIKPAKVKNSPQDMSKKDAIPPVEIRERTEQWEFSRNW
jgi:hypothetical protein